VQFQLSFRIDGFLELEMCFVGHDTRHSTEAKGMLLEQVSHAIQLVLMVMCFPCDKPTF
jgi:hypothetical protein